MEFIKLTIKRCSFQDIAHVCMQVSPRQFCNLAKRFSNADLLHGLVFKQHGLVKQHFLCMQLNIRISMQKICCKLIIAEFKIFAKQAIEEVIDHENSS